MTDPIEQDVDMAHTFFMRKDESGEHEYQRISFRLVYWAQQINKQATSKNLTKFCEHLCMLVYTDKKLKSCNVFLSLVDSLLGSCGNGIPRIKIIKKENELINDQNFKKFGKRTELLRKLTAYLGKDLEDSKRKVNELMLSITNCNIDNLPQAKGLKCELNWFEEFIQMQKGYGSPTLLKANLDESIYSRIKSCKPIKRAKHTWNLAVVEEALVEGDKISLLSDQLSYK
jgi:hypothetical protein